MSSANGPAVLSPSWPPSRGPAPTERCALGSWSSTSPAALCRHPGPLRPGPRRARRSATRRSGRAATSSALRRGGRGGRRRVWPGVQLAVRRLGGRSSCAGAASSCAALLALDGPRPRLSRRPTPARGRRVAGSPNIGNSVVGVEEEVEADDLAVRDLEHVHRPRLEPPPGPLGRYCPNAGVPFATVGTSRDPRHSRRARASTALIWSPPTSHISKGGIDWRTSSLQQRDERVEVVALEPRRSTMPCYTTAATSGLIRKDRQSERTMVDSAEPDRAKTRARQWAGDMGSLVTRAEISPSSAFRAPTRPASAPLDAADGPDRHCLARVGRPVGAAFMARRIENPISFRAETVGEPLVWGIGGCPQFGALNFEGPVVNAACGRLGAGSQQEGEQQKNRRTHSSPGSISDRARLAQLAPPLKSVCCRTGMSRPLRCLRPRKPKLPTRANQSSGIPSAAG